VTGLQAASIQVASERRIKMARYGRIMLALPARIKDKITDINVLYRLSVTRNLEKV
jgi:hypothetical protein